MEDIKSEATVKEDKQYFYLEKAWKTGDKIQLTLKADIKTNSDLQNNKYISYGPLVFALPLEGLETVIKKYGDTHFRDLHYKVTRDEGKHLHYDASADFEVIRSSYNPVNPWETYKISTALINPENNIKQQVDLVPMGGTVLRKVSF
jgi:uncharacterized protein